MRLGQRFGRYLVIEETRLDGRRRAFRCRCDCGRERVIRGYLLTSGLARSCGCANRKHGHTWKRGYSATYSAWHAMLQRCGNPKQAAYADYGGRGIRVCDEWYAFEAFLHDMGERPSSKHSLDRVDNDGNYEPGNVRWTTRDVQARNTRRNVQITFDGVTLTRTDWAARLGLSPGALKGRLDRGWSLDRALTTPCDTSMRRRA